MNLFKLIKWSASCLRLILLKIRYPSRLKVEYSGGKPVYIGKGVRIFIGKDAHVTLGSGAYLSDFCRLSAINAGQIAIGSSVYIGQGCRIISREKIVAGAHTLMADNVSLYDHNHRYDNLEKLISKQGFSSGSIEIGTDCWLSTNVVVAGGGGKNWKTNDCWSKFCCIERSLPGLCIRWHTGKIFTQKKSGT